MIIESLVIEAMSLVRRKVAATNISNKYGGDVYQEAVRRIEAESSTSMSTQQFHAKQAAEKRDFFRNRTSQGVPSQRVSQEDHNHIIDSILANVNEGIKPPVQSLLKEHGKQKNRDPEWAKRVSTHTHNKKMGKTLEVNKDHPVIRDLKAGGMYGQTYKGALQRSTYSGFAALLFSGSQLVRNQQLMQQQINKLQEDLTQIKSEVARANARLDDAELWRAEAVSMYSDGMSFGKIAKQLGKPKSTVNDHINSLVKDGKLSARPRTVSYKGSTYP